MVEMFYNKVYINSVRFRIEEEEEDDDGLKV